MNSHSLTNFHRSVCSLKIETEKVASHIEAKFLRIILYPILFNVDFDYKIYCDHYYGIQKFAKHLPEDADNNLLKEKVAELPVLNHRDFTFVTFGLPIPILYTILFPLGLIAMGKNYVILNSLQSKLQDANRTLGTTEFMLKAAVS